MRGARDVLTVLNRRLPPEEPTNHALHMKDGRFTLAISFQGAWFAVFIDDEDLDKAPETIVEEIRAVLPVGVRAAFLP